MAPILFALILSAGPEALPCPKFAEELPTPKFVDPEPEPAVIYYHQPATIQTFPAPPVYYQPSYQPAFTPAYSVPIYQQPLCLPGRG